MAIYSTDISAALGKDLRVRAQNHRGEVKATVVSLTANTAGAANNIIALAPIGVGSTVLSIEVLNATGNVIPNTCNLAFGVRGIKQGKYAVDANNQFANDEFVRIGDDGSNSDGLLKAAGEIVAIPVGAMSPNLVSATNIGKTIYELQCDADGNPLAAFKPFSKDQHVMLIMKRVDNVITAAGFKVKITYIDATPSSSSLTKIAY